MVIRALEAHFTAVAWMRTWGISYKCTVILQGDRRDIWKHLDGE